MDGNESAQPEPDLRVAGKTGSPNSAVGLCNNSAYKDREWLQQDLLGMNISNNKVQDFKSGGGSEAGLKLKSEKPLQQSGCLPRTTCFPPANTRMRTRTRIYHRDIHTRRYARASTWRYSRTDTHACARKHTRALVSVGC